MPETQAWAICPVDGCDFALEKDEDDAFFCPSCEMEMLTACPVCRERITAEAQTRCNSCGADFKG